MGRIHLFEIEDLSWCPSTIREAATDYLYGLYNVLHIYDPAYEKIIETLNKTGTTTIVDCCSGSGGPIPRLCERLHAANRDDVNIILTDKFPHKEIYKTLSEKFPSRVQAEMQSVDAMQLPENLKGLRTFFSSFHHFKPEQAQGLLQDAVNHNAPIAIFECTQRKLPDFIRTLLSPIAMLFFLPMAHRLTWQKILFTYLIPITPFTFMWDYFISNMRTYSEPELRELVSKLNAPNYTWEIGKLWSEKAKCEVPYMVGVPEKDVK